MGCDIHIVIQRQEAEGWREVVYQTALLEHQIAQGKKPVDGIVIAPDGFDGRCYDLFGILANVRNGSGFAGCKTGDGWPSIAPDRGLPEGFDEEVIAPDPTYARDYPGENYPRSLGDHSYTWITLEELKAFAWDLTSTRIYGCVSSEVYEELKGRNIAPRNYSGGISGPGITVYDEAEWETRKKERMRVSERPYVRMSWTETAREATNDWPGKIIPWLESMSDGKPIRLVFGFDS